MTIEDKPQGFGSLASYQSYVSCSNDDLSEEDVWDVLSSAPLNQIKGNSTLPVAGLFSGQTSKDSPGRFQTSDSRAIIYDRRGSDYGDEGVARSGPVKVPDWSTLAKPTFFSDEDGEMLPPHVIVARQHASKNMAAYSMIEGAGRTLKGRDLSNVRNAVWRHTGFFE